MKKIHAEITVIVGLLLAASATLFTFGPGCASSLDQTGVYGSLGNSPFGTNDNSFLFFSDKTLVDSKDSLSAFLSWELQNRQVLATVAPNVTKIADSIRDQAPLFFTNAYTVRAAYIAAFKSNPSTAGPASNAFAASVGTLSTLAASTAQLTNSVKLQ